jgi:hypothetical protein
MLAAEPRIDTLLLGCTHYPLLREPIERIVGERVAVVDSAFTTALAVEDLLDALGARAPAGSRAGAPGGDDRRRRRVRHGRAAGLRGPPGRSRGGRDRDGREHRRRLTTMARHTARLGAGILVGGLLALGASVASREIMRRAGTRLIDWEAVREIALRRLGDAGAPLSDSHRRAAEAFYRDTLLRIEPIVAEEIGSELPAALETPAVVDRSQWVELNLATFRVLLERVEQVLLEAQEGPDTPGRAVSRWVNRKVGNQQLGFMLAFLGRKVLGQYDVSLLAAGPARGRLHFVEPNIVGTAASLRVPRDEFRTFIALHEATHAFEFEAHEWLRPVLLRPGGGDGRAAGGRVGRADGAAPRWRSPVARATGSSGS